MDLDNNYKAKKESWDSEKGSLLNEIANYLATHEPWTYRHQAARVMEMVADWILAENTRFNVVDSNIAYAVARLKQQAGRGE